MNGDGDGIIYILLRMVTINVVVVVIVIVVVVVVVVVVVPHNIEINPPPETPSLHFFCVDEKRTETNQQIKDIVKPEMKGPIARCRRSRRRFAPPRERWSCS